MGAFCRCDRFGLLRIRRQNETGGGVFRIRDSKRQPQSTDVCDGSNDDV
jgi:hypothetical protein